MPTVQSATDAKKGSAAALKRLRLATGMQQSEFAKYFEMSYGTYAGWESGRRAIPAMTLRLMRLKLEYDGFVAVQREEITSIAPYNSIAEWAKATENEAFRCSKCGGLAGRAGDGKRTVLYPFCPYCGRKMKNPNTGFGDDKE